MARRRGWGQSVMARRRGWGTKATGQAVSAVRKEGPQGWCATHLLHFHLIHTGILAHGMVCRLSEWVFPLLLSLSETRPLAYTEVCLLSDFKASPGYSHNLIPSLLLDGAYSSPEVLPKSTFKFKFYV